MTHQERARRWLEYAAMQHEEAWRRGEVSTSHDDEASLAGVLEEVERATVQRAVERVRAQQDFLAADAYAAALEALTPDEREP